uniref:Uncharacterized protein n=1 Tax=Ditylenchus dipsaci TaxID=166011 RepID=A0A915EC59_9BILA
MMTIVVWDEIGKFLGVKGENRAIFANEIKRHVARINGLPDDNDFFNKLSHDVVYGEILKMFAKMVDYKSVTSQTFVSIEFLIRSIHEHISEPAEAITERNWISGVNSVSREFERMSNRLVFFGIFQKRRSLTYLNATRALKILVDDDKTEAKHVWMILQQLGLTIDEEKGDGVNLDNLSFGSDQV